MNVIVTLLVIALFCGGVVALLPVLTLAAIIVLGAGCFLVWLLPILIIANSDKTSGGEKLAWILAIVFLSWFAWIFYMLVAPLNPRPRHDDFYYY
jgi:hypothetical protein